MKQTLTLTILIYIFFTSLTSCGNVTNQNESLTNTETDSSISVKGNDNIFEDPRALTSTLSQNGISDLKEWSNPMDMGWGSLTDYYQFGKRKNGVGMQNNIAYYLEGDESSAKTLTINLNINNPADKKNALKVLNDVTEKTFKSLDLKLPKGLTKAILTSKTFKATIPNFITSVELDKSKIETWKVNIRKK